jgi:anti-sigma-K factor RskA
MVNKESVNCELVWREISNYIEGDVDGALRTAMDAHFQSCAHCKSVLEGTRNVIKVYSDERLIDEQAIEVPAGYGRRLEKRLAQSAQASRSRWSSLSGWLVPVAALALIAGGLGLANWRTHTTPPDVQHDVQHNVQHAPNNIPPDLVVVVSTDTDSKLFHVAGCSLIHDKNKVRTLTAKEAIDQGYTPCPQCLRKYLSMSGHHGVDEDDDHDEVAKLRGDGK